MALSRIVVSFGLAALVTFGLFWVMQTLIIVEGELDESAAPKVVDFVRVQQAEEVREKKRELPDKKDLEKEPPPPDIDLDPTTTLDGEGFSLGGVDEGLNGLDTEGGFNFASADGEAVPLVRVPPQYPERARGITGRVLVEFTITKSGSVRDVKVVAYEPNKVFNDAAVRAVEQWKYNPKIENGKPVEQPGQRIALVFRPDE